jgi:cytochrome b6-f complex iron-sulfur subunit
MDRKEFLTTLGLGAAAVACGYCFGGCQSNDQVVTAPTNVDFTLDLNAPANSVLKTNGGYVYNSIGVIVARTVDGTYIALSSGCTDAEGTVQYVASGNRFYCPNHGSNFATNGSVINGPASRPLTAYKTSLSGTSLRVFS